MIRFLLMGRLLWWLARLPFRLMWAVLRFFWTGIGFLVSATMFRFVGWCGFAWAAFCIGVMFYPLSLLFSAFLVLWWFRRKKRYWEHGTARWATLRDIPATKHGILLGRLKNELIRLPVVHAAVFAPTGVGKGVSFIVPHLLTCEDSCVVIDFKGELAAETIQKREAMGHKAILLNPFRTLMGIRPDGKPEPLHGRAVDSFNPIDFIDSDNPEMLDACRDLAQALVVRTGQEKDPYWNDSAEFYIRAITTFVARFAPRPGQVVPDGEDGGGQPGTAESGDPTALPSPGFRRTHCTARSPD